MPPWSEWELLAPLIFPAFEAHPTEIGGGALEERKGGGKSIVPPKQHRVQPIGHKLSFCMSPLST